MAYRERARGKSMDRATSLPLETGRRAAHPDGMNRRLPRAPTAGAPSLPAALRLGAGRTSPSPTSTARSAFYQDAIGLRQHRREGDVAALGAGGEDLLVLHEEPDARPAGRHAGLYHFALLHPSREELARALARLAATRTRIEGASDHGISEAIYLPDPDGNGIELAADRAARRLARGLGRPPRAARPARPARARRQRGAAPPRRARARRRPRAPARRRHRARARLLPRRPRLRGHDADPSAAFVSAGGYHHHLGFNIWRGRGVPPAPAGRRRPARVDDRAPRGRPSPQLRARLDAAGIARGRPG